MGRMLFFSQRNKKKVGVRSASLLGPFTSSAFTVPMPETFAKLQSPRTDLNTPFIKKIF